MHVDPRNRSHTIYGQVRRHSLPFLVATLEYLVVEYYYAHDVHSDFCLNNLFKRSDISRLNKQNNLTGYPGSRNVSSSLQWAMHHLLNPTYPFSRASPLQCCPLRAAAAGAEGRVQVLPPKRTGRRRGGPPIARQCRPGRLGVARAPRDSEEQRCRVVIDTRTGVKCR